VRKLLIASTLSLAVLVPTGCGPEFDPASLILDERVLAIRADPPEALPGEDVTLTPLVVGPTGTLAAGADYTPSWWRCADDEGDALADEERCERLDRRVDLGDAVPLTHQIDPELFGPLPQPGAEPDGQTFETERALGAVLGFWRVLGLSVQAPSGPRVDAVKRVVVFASPVPLVELDERLAGLDPRVDDGGDVVENVNPLLTGVEVREETPDGASVATLKPGGTYWLRPRFDERVLQPYFSLKMDLEGLDLTDPTTLQELEEDELLGRFSRTKRCEVPVFSWYVTAGKLRRETTVDERVIDSHYAPQDVVCPPVEGDPRRPEVRFTAPTGADIPEDGTVHAWVVMRDGRGGTDFRAFELDVQED
jgi:hypothetical protein